MVNNNTTDNDSNDICSPYRYPNFSRYNYPSKNEDIYSEEKFTFPHWDDEISPYTPKLRLKRHASLPTIYGEDMDGYFGNNDNGHSDQKNIISTPSSPSSSILSSFTSSPPSSSAASSAGDDEDEEFDMDKYQRRIRELKNQHLLSGDNEDDDDDDDVDESQLRCDKIQSDIDLAREDQKTDYDQVHKQYTSLHEDIRYLQREIEEFETNCLKGNYKFNNADDLLGYQSEPTSVVTGSLMAAVSLSDNENGDNGGGDGGNNSGVSKKSSPRRIVFTPSAATAASSFFRYKNRNNRHHHYYYYDDDDDDEDDFISDSSNRNYVNSYSLSSSRNMSSSSP